MAMRNTIRPRIEADDEDLERLQEEFFVKGQLPSASVVRSNYGATKPPVVADSSRSKKQSVFAQRRQAAKREASSAQNVKSKIANDLEAEADALASMPGLENVPEHDTQATSVPKEEQPHVPVTKNMLDLTSLLGNVLGEVTEKQVDHVAPPTIRSGTERSQRHAEGFPKPARRSEFKKRMGSRKKAGAQADKASDNPASAPSVGSDIHEENLARIESMSAEEIEQARQEIFSSLSKESIAILMNRKKTSTTTAAQAETAKTVGNKPRKDQADVDLLDMKERYFADVPVEYDKLAWMDSRFQKQQQVDDDQKHQDEPLDPVDKVYRQVRFDLQGNPVDPNVEIPVHKGLHHHGDDPDKAGYTLAELFYLVRSQVPSQRAMVLTTLSRILWHAKREKKGDNGNKGDSLWAIVLETFRRPDLASTIYLRSALDDHHLVVLVSAVQAIAALVLDEENWDEENSIADAQQFNRYLGYMLQTRRTKAQKSDDKQVKGLYEKFATTINRIRNQKEGADRMEDETEEEDDAQLAQRDLTRGLLRMRLLQRIRFLMASDSELREADSLSIERLVRVLVQLAESGPDVCQSIGEHGLVDLVLDWGILRREWPMTSEEPQSKSLYPSLTAVRLLRILAQGSRDVAKEISQKAACTLQYLAVSPEAACPGLRRLAYAFQLEALELLCVLLRYGFVMPTLQDLREPIMSWLRAVLSSSDTEEYLAEVRAATAMSLLEISLHAAADPHKTVPEHAIEWQQPIAFLPVIMAIVRQSTVSLVLDSAIGYIGTVAHYTDRFPSVDGSVSTTDIWKAVTYNESKWVRNDNSVASNSVVRYLQLLQAFASIRQPSLEHIAKEARKRFRSPVTACLVKSVYKDGFLGRIALWIWVLQVKDRAVRARLWGGDGRYDDAELEAVVRSAHAGAAETALARDLVQNCVLSGLDDKLASTLAIFYSGEKDEEDEKFSKALLQNQIGSVRHLMWPEVASENARLNSSTAWVFSPIDEFYNIDKSPLAQKATDEPSRVIEATLEAASILLPEGSSTIDHDVAVISIMKIFVTGDREGQDVTMTTDRELFWDEGVSKWIDYWLDRLCKQHMEASRTESLEAAWRRSSEHVRQPFFQFYQTFVSQYASVSFGHHGFARLLTYVMMEAGEDAVDYRFLLWSDYRDILRTIKVKAEELPQEENRVETNNTLLRAYLSAVVENKLERDQNKGDALYRFAVNHLTRSGIEIPPEQSKE